MPTEREQQAQPLIKFNLSDMAINYASCDSICLEGVNIKLAAVIIIIIYLILYYITYSRPGVKPYTRFQSHEAHVIINVLTVVSGLNDYLVDEIIQH